MIGCSEGDRARVRAVIEGVHETAYDGSDLVLRPVLFEDERHPHNPGVDSCRPDPAEDCLGPGTSH